VATTTDTEKKQRDKAAYKEMAKIARAVGASRRRASSRGGAQKKASLIRMTLGRG
jgi:hypothetical protein